MKLFLFLLLITLVGCNSKSSVSSSNGCPDKPQGSLAQKDIEEVSLNQSLLSKSGNISADKYKGYAFDAKKGSRLSYKTKDDICVWVYAPNSTLLNGDEIKLDGKHIIQISALKGSTSFSLDMSFGNLTASSASTDSGNATPAVSQKTSVSGEFDQSKAEQLIKTWLGSKSKIFAPPFDLDLLKTITTGPLYQDITKSNGPVDWLKSNNSYYSYSKGTIDKVWKFSSSDERPSMKVSVSEDRVLYGKDGRADSSASGSSTENWIYFFSKEDGVWKIYDYKKAS